MNVKSAEIPCNCTKIWVMGWENGWIDRIGSVLSLGMVCSLYMK